MKIVRAALLALGTTIATSMPAWAADPIKVRIGAAPEYNFGPIFVLGTKDNKIAERHGLDVDLSIFASGMATMEAALSNNLDVAFPHPRVLFPALDKGACFKSPIVFVSADIVRLVVSKDIKGPEDLRGRKIGTVVGAIGEIALNFWLKAKGVDPATVQLVNVSPQDMPVALGGSVDGIIWPEPIAGRALQVAGADKYHYLTGIGDVYKDVSLLEVTCEFAKTAGDKGVKAFLAAFAEAVDYVKKNPQTAAEITAKFTRTQPEAVLKFWREGGWLADSGWPAAIIEQDLQRLDRFSQFLAERGITKKQLGRNDYIDPRWMKELDPSRVR